MAITFIQQKARQQFLLLLIPFLIIVIAIILWRGFLYTSQQNLSAPALPPQHVDIDFGAFDSSQFQELGQRRTPLQIPSSVGRTNPFIPVLTP